MRRYLLCWKCVLLFLFYSPCININAEHGDEMLAEVCILFCLFDFFSWQKSLIVDHA